MTFIRTEQYEDSVCHLVYLAAHCTSVSATASRRHLRSAASHQFVVPSYRLTTYRCRAFSVAGPMTWNSLSRQLLDPIYTISVYG